MNIRDKIAQRVSDDFTQTYLGNKSVLDTADAIIELIKDGVKPLEWRETIDRVGLCADSMNSIYFALDDGYWCLWANGNIVTHGNEASIKAAKAAAQADFIRRFLSAFNLT